MTALDSLIEQLPRTSLIVGKGGVGKTTCAVGLAVTLARRGESVLLLSTDPAAALSEVTGSPVRTTAAPVASVPRLDARQLAATELRRDFLDRWRDVIAEIIDRGTYLDRSDVDGLVDAALPGADEIFALLALADTLADPSAAYQRIVVDTAPTGHTLRLLALPDTFRALLAMLDEMQDKHRFMVRALTHRYRRDRADDFIDEMRSRIDRLRGILADPASLAAVVVMRDEPMVIAETSRYVEELARLRIRVAGVIVNAADATADLSALGASVANYVVPRVEPPRGVDAATAALSMMRERPTARTTKQSKKPRASSAASASGLETSIAGLVRPLTIVGGKGGVGKSTIACALAIAAADEDAGDVLLVSTDPAPSIADALGETEAAWARGDREHIVEGVPGLVARQMDAAAAFARLRDEYQDRIDGMFDAIVRRGVDADRDRRIMRELLALAPPGIDELFALSLLGDALFERRFGRVVVDPAPTGHLLRLLEMPAIALDWTHRLMRLMLKYREAVGLGAAAEELLAFAKRTRELDALLHDAVRSGVLIAALDEPVVRAETSRLAAAIDALGVGVIGIAWNRVTIAVPPLPESRAPRQFCADYVSPPPIGVAALRAWGRSWREMARVN
ncbi:MAG TPA: ArsA family ATPase [Gemmatimonadaceae bacterium]|nr:ArsA family ATPase [Gemmatimonadaceae bacterium]